MKFNLKNRPKRSDYPSDESGLLHFALDSTKWFEGFEKEFRDNNDEIRATAINLKDALDKHMKLIKEILGAEAGE